MRNQQYLFCVKKAFSLTVAVNFDHKRGPDDSNSPVHEKGLYNPRNQCTGNRNAVVEITKSVSWLPFLVLTSGRYLIASCKTTMSSRNQDTNLLLISNDPLEIGISDAI